MTPMAGLGRGWGNGAPGSETKPPTGILLQDGQEDRQLKEFHVVSVFAAATVPYFSGLISQAESSQLRN